MSKITLNDVANLIDETTAKNTINANSAVTQTAFDNTLSRDGTSPNQMWSNLDMNSNRILNLPAPIGAGEPVRLHEIQEIILAQLPTAIDSNVYETVASAALTNISASVKSIRTIGYYTAGDGGGAEYYHASGSTSGGFQSADGQWWQLVKTGEPNVKQYGAKGDGVASESSSFANAITPWAATTNGSGLGYNLKVPPGLYLLPTTTNIYNSNAECKLIGVGRPVLSHTGTGIGFNANQPTGFGPLGFHLENLTFKGNANTNILLYLNNQMRLDWKNIHLKNASPTGWAFRIDFCIESKFSHITHDQGDSSIPAVGLQVGTGFASTTGVTECQFDNLTLEGCGTAIEVANGNTSGFYGGTCENNGIGVHVSQYCYDLNFEHLDCEANTSYDWFIEGRSIHLNNCNGSSANGLTLGGRNNKVTGGFYTTIAGGAGVHNIYDGVSYSGSFSPSGTYKWRNIFNRDTGIYVADNWT